jgi:hypothetical protein
VEGWLVVREGGGSGRASSHYRDSEEGEVNKEVPLASYLGQTRLSSERVWRSGPTLF